jgi:hypothetical protein
MTLTFMGVVDLLVDTVKHSVFVLTFHTRQHCMETIWSGISSHIIILQLLNRINDDQKLCGLGKLKAREVNSGKKFAGNGNETVNGNI